MTLSGQLSDFSLPELFQVIEKGNQTGTLTFRIFNETEQSFDRKYIGFESGRVVSVSNDLSGQDLLLLMKQENLIDSKDFLSLIKLIHGFELKVSIGDYLQSKNILNSEQVKSIFDIQVVRRACQLFELENAWFTFNSSMKSVFGELTGFSIAASELSLMALRSIQKWTNFSEKFPDATSGLLRANNTKIFHEFTDLEEKVLTFSTGQFSLKQISQKLQISLEDVQKISFGLISTGIVEELPILEAPLLQLNRGDEIQGEPTHRKSLCVNQDFLSNLTSYLQNKTASPTVSSSNTSKA